MSAIWLLILLAALIALSELARRLERTDLRVYLRSMPGRTAQTCPVCRHVLYAARCYCPERTEP